MIPSRARVLIAALAGLEGLILTLTAILMGGPHL